MVGAKISQDGFLAISRAISAAALDPVNWQDVLMEMSRAVDGIRTHFVMFDSAAKHANSSYFHGYDPAIIEDYDRHWAERNAWAPGFAARATGEVVAAHTMLPDEALRKTEFYHEWVVPQEDAAFGGGAILDQTAESVFLIGGNVRRADGIDVQERWLNTLALAMPLLRQAAETNKALTGLRLENHLLRSGHRANGAAVLVMRGDRRLVQASPEGHRLLDDGTLARADAGYRVRLTDAEADLALSRSFAAQPGLGSQMLQLTTLDGSMRCAQVLVMGEEILDAIPIVTRGLVTLPLTVLIIMPANVADSREALVREFGMTASEADVAASFSQGATPEQIADLRQARVSTIRQQIKAAMSKTGTQRQVEFALLVAGRLHDQP